MGGVCPQHPHLLRDWIVSLRVLPGLSTCTADSCSWNRCPQYSSSFRGPARPGRQLGQRRSALKIPAGAQLSTTANLPLLISWSVGLVVHPEHSAGSQVPQGHPHFIFPFPVKDIINPFVVRLTLPGSVRIHSIFHLPHFKPMCTSSPVVSVCL